METDWCLIIMEIEGEPLNEGKNLASHTRRKTGISEEKKTAVVQRKVIRQGVVLSASTVQSVHTVHTVTKKGRNRAYNISSVIMLFSSLLYSPDKCMQERRGGGGIQITKRGGGRKI